MPLAHLQLVDFDWLLAVGSVNDKNEIYEGMVLMKGMTMKIAVRFSVHTCMSFNFNYFVRKKSNYGPKTKYSF